MADIRINALATTAASTASDDFIAVDGSANGTRKLNAYSPTFGGNLTVSGNISLTSNTSLIQFPSTTDLPKIQLFSTTYGLGIDNTDAVFFAGSGGGIRFKADSVSGTQWGRINGSGLSLTGNLTVSGAGNSQINGNLGIGAAPSAWQTLYGIKAIDLTNGAVFGATNDVNLAYNSYFNSSNQWIYKDNKAAGRYTQDQGVHQFFVAASGTAGNQITWTQAMTLNLSGNLLIGTTTDGGQKLQVSGTSNFSNPGSSTIANFTNSANADFQIVLTASTSAKIGPSTPTSLILQTNGTTALTLDSNQNVLIGASSSALNFGGKGITLYNATAPEIKLIDSYTGGASTDGSSITLSNADLVITNLESAPIILKTANTTALTLDSSQNATFAGKVAIGGGTAIAKVVSVTSTDNYSTLAGTSSTNVDVAVSGCTTTDAVIVNPADGSPWPNGLIVNAFVVSTGTVRIWAYNSLSGNLAVGSRTVRVTTIKY